MTTQRAILTSLFRVKPFTIPIATILADCSHILGSAPTVSELRGDLAELEAKRQIIGVRDEDRGTVYRITADGEARHLS